MEITKYRHSCLHVVDGEASILIDPGSFSAGFETLTGLTAVLVTHAHADHLDLTRIGALLAANPDARLIADPGAAAQLADQGIAATVATAGDEFDVGTSVRVLGEDHAVIYREIPVIANRQFLIGGRLLHPGDSLDVPSERVEILALPAAAPWMALKEAIDYLRAVAPTVAIPIHEALVAVKTMYYARFVDFALPATTVSDIDDGHPLSV